MCLYGKNQELKDLFHNLNTELISATFIYRIIEIEH